LQDHRRTAGALQHQAFAVAAHGAGVVPYGLLSGGEPAQAIEIFKLATVLYPSSANSFDSLAEAYEQRGDKANAILHYQRSLQLNPKNDNAKQHLELLGAAAQAATGS
jgi:tetratricopeptide (TPR) repeat protein